MTDRCVGLPYERKTMLAVAGADTPEKVEYLLRMDRTRGGMLVVAQAPITEANFRMVFQGTTLVKGEQLEPML